MGINGINQQNYTYYNRGVNNNFTLANSYANTPVFTGNNQTVIGDSFNNKTVTPKDGKDDGSIGFWGALKNMTKGIGNFFKGMVCDENGKFSIGRILTTLAMGAVIGAACAFLPTIAIAGTTFSTLGLISAGFMGFAVLHAGKSAIDIMSAKTDAEAEQAWQGMGSALTEGGLAYLGYRASGGIFAKDVVPTTPPGSTRKATPNTETVINENAVVTPKLEIEPVVNKPVVESVVEEPFATTPKIEPVAEPIVFNQDVQLPSHPGKHKVPRFLYHFTTPEGYESMMRTGKISASVDAFLDKPAVFMVELDNLIKNWCNTIKIEDLNLELITGLLMNVGKSLGNKEIVLVKIPTSHINCNNLSVRSQKTFFMARADAFAKLEEYQSKDLHGKIPATQSNLFKQRKEPIEYIYYDNIQTNSIEKVGSADINISENTTLKDVYKFLENMFENTPEAKSLIQFKLTNTK